MGDGLRGAVPRDAAIAGKLCPGDGENPRTCSLSASSFRNAVDARSRGRSAGWQSGAGFFVDEARQDSTGATVLSDRAESSGRAGLWKLHLTALPAGGSPPEQALQRVRRPDYISRGLHHRGASQRRLADGEQRKRAGRVRQSSQ